MFMRGKIQRGLSVWYRFFLVWSVAWGMWITGGCGQADGEKAGGGLPDEGAAGAACEAEGTQVQTKAAQGASVAEAGADIPGEENWYIIELREKTEGDFDLDGDGVKERIYYAALSESGRTCSVWVDETEYRDVFTDFDVRESYFGVVDLERGDGYMELALYGRQEDGAAATCFFRYGEDGFTMVGIVPGYIDETSVDNGDAHLDGRGTVFSRFPLTLLQSWEASGQWKLDDDGLLRKRQEELYFPLMTCAEREGKRVTVQAPFILYMERNRESGYVEVSAAGAEVDFQATDDREWMLLSVEGGCTGWLHCRDSYLVECGVGEYVPAQDVFENLTLDACK